MKKGIGLLAAFTLTLTSLCAVFSASAAERPTDGKVVQDYNSFTENEILDHNSNEAQLKITAGGIDGSAALQITPKNGGASLGNLTFWGDYFSYIFGSAIQEGSVDLTKYDGFMFYVKNVTAGAELSIQLNKVMYGDRGVWAHMGKGVQVFGADGSDKTADILQPMGDTEYKFVFPETFEGWLVFPAKVADNKDDVTAGFYSKDGLEDLTLADVQEINFWGNEKTHLTIDNVTLYGGDEETPSTAKPSPSRLINDFNDLEDGSRILITTADSGKVFAKKGWLNFDRSETDAAGNFTFFQEEDMSLLFKEASEENNGAYVADISLGDGIMFDIKNEKDAPSQYIQITADFLYQKDGESKQYRQQIGFGILVFDKNGQDVTKTVVQELLGTAALVLPANFEGTVVIPSTVGLVDENLGWMIRDEQDILKHPVSVRDFKQLSSIFFNSNGRDSFSIDNLAFYGEIKEEPTTPTTTTTKADATTTTEKVATTTTKVAETTTTIPTKAPTAASDDDQSPETGTVFPAAAVLLTVASACTILVLKKRGK